MYKLELSTEMIGIIAQGLSELPMKISLNTFAEVKRQVEEQDKAKNDGQDNPS